MKVSAKASNCDRRTAVSGYFSSLITAHPALFTSFSPLFPRAPLFPALRSNPTAVSGASRKKQIPSSQHLWNQEMLDQLNYFDGELEAIDDIPEALKHKHKHKHKTVFGIDFEYIIDDAAHRQKWIDQSQSVILFPATPEMQGASARSNLNRTYRRAWDKGLKTTYYLRTLQASNIEKSTIDVKKETRGVMGATPEPKTFTPEERNACSIDAMLNGGTCEACQ